MNSVEEDEFAFGFEEIKEEINKVKQEKLRFQTRFKKRQ